jgi:hypothetical protein
VGHKSPAQKKRKHLWSLIREWKRLPRRIVPQNQMAIF